MEGTACSLAHLIACSVNTKGDYRIDETNLSFYRPFFFPAFDQVLDDLVGFLQESLENTSHLPGSIVFLHNRLVLVNNHGDTFKEGSESSDIIEG